MGGCTSTPDEGGGLDHGCIADRSIAWRTGLDSLSCVSSRICARLAAVCSLPSLALSAGMAFVSPGARVMPPFAYTVGPVTPALLGSTWRRGCPVGSSQLRLLALGYAGFDRRAHLGKMVVNVAVVGEVVKAFAILYAKRFPIRSMVPEAAFHGSDPASMAADNTSAFNCRLAVTTGPRQWSVHAYGEAVDVNPVENPYLEGGKAQPRAGAAYLERTNLRPGMAVPGGALVGAFAAVSWYWGGRWSSNPDYQHFSLTGG